ncbi:MAG: YraN family protein [Hyphomicrobiales bacterium]|nr:YraN family protein [Hyphomicrobiales bacterium]
MSGRRVSSTARRRSYRRGLTAETLAAALLRLKGYRILARRFRVRLGEIDMIARRGAHFAFVEVKARPDAGEVLTARQRARIHRAAEAWLAAARLRGALPEEFSASFDLVLVRPWRWPQHVPRAFGDGL